MEAAELRVFQELEARLTIYNATKVWIFRLYDVAAMEPVFAEQQRKIDKIRMWAEALPKEEKTRAHYLHWLKYYYQSGLDEAREEMRTQCQRRQAEKSRAALERVQREATGMGPIPTPQDI
jgi:hypothetical protein